MIVLTSLPFLESSRLEMLLAAVMWNHHNFKTKMVGDSSIIFIVTAVLPNRPTDYEVRIHGIVQQVAERTKKSVV